MARTLTGIIVSDKMQKTAVVAVEISRKHPKYLKYYKVTSRLKAHNEGNQYHTGDIVTILETRPLSKEKRWTITGKVVTNPSTSSGQASRLSDSSLGKEDNKANT